MNIKVKKIINFSLQHESETREAIQKDTKDGNIYILESTSTIVDWRLLTLLIRNGYELQSYATMPTFKHKNYHNDEDEKKEVE